MTTFTALLDFDDSYSNEESIGWIELPSIDRATLYYAATLLGRCFLWDAATAIDDYLTDTYDEDELEDRIEEIRRACIGDPSTLAIALDSIC